ncbi:hypothetical protein A3Q56_05594 [Intoshia linei]|uniref:RRM domain-containing protein n=1 Tax=Intoshia linei TaxID=1819745 RepID=A0A177AXA4_9BILA|nr:hypothetical protein A3Q56_05594 [Intoshia linei]
MSYLDVDKSVCVYNLDKDVTEDILFELFLQIAPLSMVKVEKDTEHVNKGFVEFIDKVSVHYSMQTLNGIHLFKRPIRIDEIINRQQNMFSDYKVNPRPNVKSRLEYPNDGRNVPYQDLYKRNADRHENRNARRGYRRYEEPPRKRFR